MTPSSTFKKFFAVGALRDTYLEKVRDKVPVGIDRINRTSFEASLAKNLATASRKSLDGTYRFTRYKEKLILKGRDSWPRLIAIPTIRDKIVLKALHDLLRELLGGDLRTQLVHQIVHETKSATRSGEFTYFLRFDIKDFYPSIDRSLLIEKLTGKIRNKKIIRLVSEAIEQSTLSAHEHTESSAPSRGVPQGLSISGLLADFYLADLDIKHEGRKDYKYFRYVDDILVLCSEPNAELIREAIHADFQSLRLETNPKKEKYGLLAEGFQYLGYHFTDTKVSVRKESVEKLVGSFIEALVQHKYSRSQEYKILEWWVNLRLTGCRFNGSKYGWMFFFSQIDDLSLLFHLDKVFKKLFGRFEVDVTRVQLRKISRTFHEITKNLSGSRYIPDFDLYTVPMKRLVLGDIFKIPNAAHMPEHEVESQFRRKIFRAVKDLEKDIAQVS